MAWFSKFVLVLLIAQLAVIHTTLAAPGPTSQLKRRPSPAEQKKLIQTSSSQASKTSVRVPSELVEEVRSSCELVTTSAEIAGGTGQAKLEQAYKAQGYPLAFVVPTGFEPNQYYKCPRITFERITLGTDKYSGVEKILVEFTSSITGIIDRVTQFLIDIFGKIFITMVGQGVFINSSIVKGAWPFIQGVANLGFIFALLYIALATTVRMESVGTSIQRLLPKLLIGALLVNFSLVLGGLVIDASRLLMAVEIRLLADSGTTIENFTSKIAQPTKLIELQIESNRSTGKPISYSIAILHLIQTTLFRILFMIALGVIAINMFVRYITLLILLIFSPFAYLAIALPQTAGYFKEWWSKFLKWTLYGPIAIFFLAVITRIQNVNVALPKGVEDQTFNAGFFNQFVQFIIVIALFFVANKAGKSFSSMGSDAMMSLTKRTGSFIRNNPVAAGALASIATGGVGAVALGLGAAAGRYAGRGALNQVRDFKGDLTSGLVKNARKGKLGSIAQFVAGVERDKDGKRTKDADDSFGSGLAGKITGYSPTLDKRSEEIRETIRTGTGPAIKAAELTESSLVARLDETTIKAIANNAAQPEQFKAIIAALVKDKDGKIPEKTKSIIVNEAITVGQRNNNAQIGLVQGIASNAKLVGKLKEETIDALMQVPDSKTTENLLKSLATEKKD